MSDLGTSTVTEKLLTNQAFGYPTRGHLRRHLAHILAVVHQTATTPYDGQAMALRNARNGAGYTGNTATYYVDADGDAVHAVDGTKYASWGSAPEKIAYVDESRASMAAVVRHFAAGFNPNECVWDQIECVGKGTEPWTDAQFEQVATIISARSRLSGLPINRNTVVPHRDMDTVNRPSDPWPAAIREARMANLIARAKEIAAGGVADVPILSSYVPGQEAQIVAGANVREEPKLSGPILRKTDKDESWTVVGWVKGDTSEGSDQWICRWNAGRWEYTHRVNVALVAPPADASPYTQVQLDAAVKAASDPLRVRLATVKAKIAAVAADVADD